MANKSIKIPELETELHSNQQSWNAKGYTFTGNTYTGKINNQDKTPKIRTQEHPRHRGVDLDR